MDRRFRRGDHQAPPFDTIVSLAVPPAETISVPPLSIEVLRPMPPSETFSVAAFEDRRPAVRSARRHDDAAAGADRGAEIAAARQDFESEAAADVKPLKTSPEPSARMAPAESLTLGGSATPPTSSTMPPLETVTPLTVPPDSMISVPPALMKCCWRCRRTAAKNSVPPLLTVVLVSSCRLRPAACRRRHSRRCPRR